MHNFFWVFETMKTTKTAFFLLLFFLLAIPRGAFAQGEFLDLDSFGGSSDSGFLSGDYVSSAPSDSASGGDLLATASGYLAGSGGDTAGELAGGMAGDLTTSVVSGMVGGGFQGEILGGLAGDLVSDWVGDQASTWVSGQISELTGSDMFGDFLGDLLSVPEISSLQETLNGMASSMQSAIVTPNIPHYRILWMFSGESAIDEVKSLFSGNYSNLQEGLENLKQMF